MKPIFAPLRVSPLLLSVAAISLAASACDGPRSNETVHPLPGRIPGSQQAMPITRDSLPSNMASGRLAKWTAARDAIRNARLVVAIGTAGTDRSAPSDPTVFGSLADAAVDPSGLVYVLDEQAQEVRAFDFDGQFIHKLGGYGEGPSELRHAVGVELLSDGRVLVASRDLRVKVFSFADHAWRATQTIEAPVGPRDICSLRDGRVFISGYRQEANMLIHQLPLSESDSLPHAFGEGYRDDDWLVQMALAQGTLACANSGNGLVVFGHQATPLIRAFDATNGSLLWASKLASFSGMPIYKGVNEMGRNYVRRGRPTQWDVLGTIDPIAEGQLLVQVGHGSEARQTVAIESYLLDAESGAGGFLGDQVPRAVPFDGGFVALHEDPFPRLEVWAFRNSPVIKTTSMWRRWFSNDGQRKDLDRGCGVCGRLRRRRRARCDRRDANSGHRTRGTGPRKARVSAR